MGSDIQAASSELSQRLQSLLNAGDVEELKRLQLLILGRLQDSNAVLSHYNDFSERSYNAVFQDFHKNTKLLKSMKADLDYIFKRLRALKTRISKQFPDAFIGNEAEEDQRPDLEKPKLDKNK